MGIAKKIGVGFCVINAAFGFAAGLREGSIAAITIAGFSTALAVYLVRKPCDSGRNRSTHDVIEDSLDAADWSLPRDVVLSQPKPVQAHLRIGYRDSVGKITERNVAVKECETQNLGGYMIGFCELRQSIRTFRLDRIAQATDLETGEVIRDVREFAARRYAESPIAALDALLEKSADPIRALFYIGKADGRFTAKEKQIFLSYCQSAAGDERITMRQIEDICKQMSVPTKQAFKLICGRLSKLEPTERSAILNAAETMIAIEKTVSVEEAEALAYMRKRLAVA